MAGRLLYRARDGFRARCNLWGATMTAAEIIGSLLTAYAVGWVWGKSMLAFKQLAETST